MKKKSLVLLVLLGMASLLVSGCPAMTGTAGSAAGNGAVTGYWRMTITPPDGLSYTNFMQLVQDSDGKIAGDAYWSNTNASNGSIYSDITPFAAVSGTLNKGTISLVMGSASFTGSVFSDRNTMSGKGTLDSGGRSCTFSALRIQTLPTK